jgi:metallophosphoesterase superfamily enzyme
MYYARLHMGLSSSTTSLVISDIHFPYQDKKCWRAFKSFVDNNEIQNIFVNGDIWDLEAISSFMKGGETSPHIVKELKQGITELNWLYERIYGDMVIIPGNHENRWDKTITAAFGVASKGLKNLSFQDQLYAQGLDVGIKIKPESVHNIGSKLGQFVIRHGDKQASRNGGGKNVASNRIQNTLGASEVVGHHHVAQMICRSFDDRLATAIANPCLANPMAYATGASWQRGFTILEQAPDSWVTPYVVVMHKGKFAYAGKVYAG